MTANAHAVHFTVHNRVSIKCRRTKAYYDRLCHLHEGGNADSH